jgi:hypothetical protein
VILCAVCIVHKKTRNVGLLVEPQNQGRRFLSVWSQNRWLRVSRFGPQNWQVQFDDLGLKITTTVSWFGHQIKQAMVCWLHHKTNGRRKTTQDAR